MPGLDVSFVTADPMLADSFSVSRRLDSVDSKGRTVPFTEETFPSVLGVVTQEKTDLARGDNAQLLPRVIFIATKFELRSESEAAGTGYQPDVVTWCCTRYIVKSVQPYARFGSGHHQATCESIAAVDAPQ